MPRKAALQDPPDVLPSVEFEGYDITRFTLILNRKELEIDGPLRYGDYVVATVRGRVGKIGFEPAADARWPQHAGVEIAFDSRHGHLTYATDAFDSWQANLRAIALSLEALRAVDRYGVSRGQQYAGWKALPAASSTAHLPGDRTAALDVLASVLGRAPQEPLVDDIREAMKRTHPDAGGTAEAFQAVEAARRILLRTA